MGKYLHQTTVRLPEHIFESLELRVKQNNSSLNIEIVNILDAVLSKNDKDKLCSEAIELIKSIRQII